MSCKSEMICPCNKDSFPLQPCCIQLITKYISCAQKALPSSEGYYDISHHVGPILVQYFCQRPRAHNEFFTCVPESDNKYQLQITGKHHNIVSLPPNPSNSKEPHKSFGFYKANFNQLEKCTVKWCFKIGLSNNDESDRSEDEDSDDWFYDDPMMKDKDEITFCVNSLDFSNRCSLTTDGYFYYKQNDSSAQQEKFIGETIDADDILTIKLRLNKGNGTVVFYKNSDTKPLISTNHTDIRKQYNIDIQKQYKMSIQILGSFVVELIDFKVY
eukprot:477837_1